MIWHVRVRWNTRRRFDPSSSPSAMHYNKRLFLLTNYNRSLPMLNLTYKVAESPWRHWFMYRAWGGQYGTPRLVESCDDVIPHPALPCRRWM
jgi:hypothetical protein